MLPGIPNLLILGMLLAITTYTDLRRHRIANRWILTGLAAALFNSVVFGGGLSGIGDVITGTLVGFLMFIPFYLLRGMAAGDVKLMAMVGAFVGPQIAFFAGLCSLLAGGVIGIAYLIILGGALAWFRRMFGTVKMYLLTHDLKLSYIQPDPGEAATLRFPYAVAISAGTVSALLWNYFYH